MTKKSYQKEMHGETVQDTANAVKDGANLAKNIASQNYIGAAKDALNLLKNKKVRKVFLISAMMSILTPILLASMILAIFTGVGNAIEEAIKKTNEWFAQNYTYGIIYYTDEQLDSIINSIENLGVSLENLNLMGDVEYDEDEQVREENERKAFKKYLIKFLLAQEKLRTLNPKETGAFGDLTFLDNYIAQVNIRNAIITQINNGQDLEYGSVYVHRTGDLEEISKDNLNKSNQLEFLAYENVQPYIDNNDSNILKYFSVDPDGNMVFAREVKTKTDVKGNWGDSDLSSNNEETKYELVKYNYQPMINQYTTTVQFFVYLTMITQNPEFSAKIADLASDGEIKLVIVDNYETTTESSTNDYTMNYKELKENDDGEYEQNTYQKEFHQETTVETTKNNPEIVVVYADTWFAEQEITYRKVETKTDGIPEIIEDEDEEEPLWDTVSENIGQHWKTDSSKTKTINTAKIEYVEAVHGDTKYKKDDFIELLDTKFKIPNSNREEAPGSNFVSGAEMFLGLLQMSPNCQKIEQYIRDVLNTYTNSKKYGNVNLEELITDAITIDLSGDYFQEGGIKNEEQRKKIQAKIENELLNTKVHSNSTNQEGPFAEWWTLPKNSGLLYQCPWWVYGRAQMYLEKIGSSKTRNDLYKIYGNGADWYDKNVANKQFNYGSIPKPNSIISWKGGSEKYGHVAYVEGVADDGIYISHAGNGTSWFGITKIGLDGNVGWSGYTLNGYIYLDEPIT